MFGLPHPSPLPEGEGPVWFSVGLWAHRGHSDPPMRALRESDISLIAAMGRSYNGI